MFYGVQTWYMVMKHVLLHQNMFDDHHKINSMAVKHVIWP